VDPSLRPQAGSAGTARDTPHSIGTVCKEVPKLTSRVYTEDPPGISTALRNVLPILDFDANSVLRYRF